MKVKKNKDSNNNRPSDENIPPSLADGITIGLLGYFIYQIPHPLTKGIGSALVGFSVYQCGNSIYNKKDEDWKAQKEIEKRQRQEEEEIASVCSICDDRHCPYHDERKKKRGYSKRPFLLEGQPNLL